MFFFILFYFICVFQSKGKSSLSNLHVPSTIHYSRTTQRLMRELISLNEENKLRQSLDDDSSNNTNKKNDHKNDQLIKQSLLRPDSRLGAVLRVTEDPVESSCTFQVNLDT